MGRDYTIEIEGLELLVEEHYKTEDKKEKAVTANEMIAIREKTGMSRKEFADAFGIPYRTISDWEHGERKMPDYVLRLLAYKVRMEYVEKRG